MKNKVSLLAGVCLALWAGPAAADTLGQAIADFLANP